VSPVGCDAEGAMKARPWLSLPLLAGALAAAVFGCSREDPPSPPAAPPPKAARPNVLLISLDTLRPDHLGCYGYGKPTSPNLDRFAKSALVFASCRAQAPWTLPSHMALFTSMLPTSNGVDNLNKVLPRAIPTLAELLSEEGYRTAALVNNGQMRKHWGFARGFATWREFPVDTPAGNCENLTREALAWLKSEQAKAPFFLFLHYYDTHDPYEAPKPYRERLGTTLTGKQASALCWRYRTPEANLADKALLADLIAAYDAEIAWLDHELGKLLEAVPPETLVVIFSDHGEAFEEHGWTLHGATLYEEETRVPLLIKLPDTKTKAAVLKEPVMLLDVAPTILARCGVRLPAGFQGTDLSPLWQGKTLPPRLIPSETKAVLEGRYCLSVTAEPLKGIYSLFDGRFEMYKLPDEHTDLATKDRAAAKVLLKSLRAWMEGEQYWLIHAAGRGDFEATVELSEGSLALFIPVGFNREEVGDIEALAKGRVLRWHVHPGGLKRPKSMFLQPERPDTSLRVDFRVNGSAAKETVFLGKEGRHPQALPAMVSADLAPVSPFLERPFTATKEGFHVFRHRSAEARPRPGQVRPLDDETIKQLRSLGYLR
jgi:arylsulfatase A-like enzyme